MKKENITKTVATRLVSYGPDDVDEDEDPSEASDQSADENEEDHAAPTSPMAAAGASPGPRGLAGIDSNNIQLPPEPPGRCSRELQDKIAEYYMRMKQVGFDPNREIQRLTSFRNPSIYEKLIQQFKIDEKGSNFPLDVYNPHMWSKESFYDELDKAQKKDMERREKERKEKTKIEFISGTKRNILGITESQKVHMKNTEADKTCVLKLSVCVLKLSVSEAPPAGVPLQRAAAIAKKSRWLAALAAYDFDIKYRPGEHNVDADTLSRLPGRDEEYASGDVSSEIVHTICGAVHCPAVETHCLSDTVVDMLEESEGQDITDFTERDWRRAQDADKRGRNAQDYTTYATDLRRRLQEAYKAAANAAEHAQRRQKGYYDTKSRVFSLLDPESGSRKEKFLKQKGQRKKLSASPCSTLVTTTELVQRTGRPV
nr:hypothetical protein BaRGS_002474 [Batillaria attramentaria]